MHQHGIKPVDPTDSQKLDSKKFILSSNKSAKIKEESKEGVTTKIETGEI